jgi:hypothetical protein
MARLKYKADFDLEVNTSWPGETSVTRIVRGTISFSLPILYLRTSNLWANVTMISSVPLLAIPVGSSSKSCLMMASYQSGLATKAAMGQSLLQIWMEINSKKFLGIVGILACLLGTPFG